MSPLKKLMLFVGGLALLIPLLMAAKTPPVKLVRLTLVNKSGMDIEVTLTGTCEDNSYFLRVTEGTRQEPTVKDFTIIPDTYQVNAYFDELWDPVYGASCENRQSRVDITHNTRVVIFECDVTPPNAGEPPKIKLGGPTGRGRPR